MTMPLRDWPLLQVALACLATSALAAIDAPAVERTAPGQISVRWKSDDPVDVFLAARPDAPVAKARLAAHADKDGVYQADWTDPARPYVILRDETDGRVVRVAERLLTLDRGSNFRDVGGYPAAGGKHVRWGVIYRTAAMPMLDAADYLAIGRLHIAEDIDLRSVEERQIAPDHIGEHTSARYFAIDYPAASIFGRMSVPGSAPSPTVDLYREWPISLAPQYREIFRQLLRHDGAVAYHCSAGQDRTGLATALVLLALGVPRDVVMQDYHLSTADRRPENEMPPIEPGEYPGNVVADFYLKMKAAGVSIRPRPLYDAHGQPLLQHSLDEIDARWGSVDNYLDKVLGMGTAQIARLRMLYLE
jgi:protein-tyrosine phosphatase